MNAATNESMNEEIGATSSSQFFAVSLQDRALATILCVCCQFHCPPGSDPLSFCNLSMQSKFFEMHTLLSLQSGAHFADLIFQKCFDPLSCLRFLCEIELSLQSRVHFADLIFQKCSEWQRSFCYSPVRSSSKSAPRLSVFEHFEVEIELSLQSCAFLSATFPDRRLQPRKQRPYFGDHGSHFTQQKHVSCPRVFPPVNARVPELSLFPTPG